MANYTSRANVASATATTLPEGSNYIVVTGTTTITSLSARPTGEVVILRFSGALTLTHNATSLILQGAGNLVTAASDLIVLVSEGSGNWREVERRTAGIQFPATQAASADANNLDDYEEGAWTPTIIGSTTPGSQTYDTQVGRYVKVGGLVIVTCRVTITAKDGAMAGNALIGGLPFVTENVSGSFWNAAIGYIDNVNLAVGYTQFAATIFNNDSTIDLYENGDNVSTYTVAVADIAANTGIHLTMAYRTA